MTLGSRSLGALGLVALSFHASEARACAACRNPSLPTAQASGGPLDEDALRTSASISGTSVHVVHSAGCADVTECDELPIQPEYLHDQHLYPLELRLAAEYGLNEALGIELQLPLRTVVSRIDFSTPEGQAYAPLDPDVHHRNETLVGLADPVLMARLSGLSAGYFLAARVGLSFPLGSTEPDPFALGDQGLRHQHIQFGTGTFDPTLSLEAARRVNRVTLSWFVQASGAVYENRHGFQAPLRLQSALDASTELFAKLHGGLGLGIFREGAERWQGRVRQDASLGRTEVYAELTLARRWLDTRFSLSGRFPLYRYIIAGDEDLGEYSSPLALQLSATHVFEF